MTTIQGQGIRSVETGLALLDRIVGAEAALRLADVAAAAGMTPSKARGYLVSLLRAGYVVQDAGGRYAAGPRALQLGMVALGRLDVLALCRAAMAPLAAELSETVALSLWTDRGPVVVDKIESRRDRIYEVRVGAEVTLWPTATGRVFMAHLEPSTWEGALGQLQAAGGIDAAARAGLPDELAQVRQEGYAATLPATVPGFSAIAAPVRDHRGALRAVLTILGRAEGFDIAGPGRNATALRAAADDVSRQLGHAG